MRDRLNEKDMPQEIRKKVEREIERYGDLPAGSHEQPPLRTYIECMLELPWKEETEDNTDLANAKAVLEADHYGLSKVKERILEYLAVANLTGKVNGQILCFVGPPGVGKTSVSASIARVVIPLENKGDVDDVPQEVKDALHITYVKNAMEVLHAALTHMPAPKDSYTPVASHQPAARGGMVMRDMNR